MFQATAHRCGRVVIAITVACAAASLAACDQDNANSASSGGSPSAPAAGSASPADTVNAPVNAAASANVNAKTTTESGTRGVIEGANYVFITAFNQSTMTMTVDPIDWFTGDAAVQACAEDGITESANDWCLGWYYRNNNPTTTDAAVSGDVAIQLAWMASGDLCPTSDNDCAVSLKGFGEQLSQRNPMLATVGVTNGSIVWVSEIYTP